MPELPEVEMVRRGLEPVMKGARFLRVEQRRKDLRFPFPRKFAESLEGRTVTGVERRAKYLLVHLSRGGALLMHLGMTGRFSVSMNAKNLLPPPLWGRAGEGGNPRAALPEVPPPLTPPHEGEGNQVRMRGRGDREGTIPARQLGEYVYDTGADPKHDHAVFHMSGGATITYNDPRRFGFMLLISEPEIETHEMLQKLGVEPLGNQFSAGYLVEKARGRKTDLKAFLLDQRIVAGLGNIYVCEALHRTGLSPKRSAGSLAGRSPLMRARTDVLAAEIRNVLVEAIEAGGSTLNDYRQADGTPGAFQDSHLVYDREGEPCRRPGCGGTIRRIVQSGRSTFYCLCCQK